MAPQQLPLDLQYRPALGMADFVLAPGNQDAVAWIDRWPDWPSHALAIHGPKGSGKTHLAHVWQARSSAVFLVRAPGSDAALPRAVVLDSPQDWPEAALLHLYNRLREAGGHLLIVSETPPARWAVSLPDLASRLASVPAVALAAPDDGLLVAVMAKQFADRGLEVNEDVLRYVASRVERSFAVAAEMVARIDHAALAQQRRVTLALARECVSGETGNS
ncbi:MAG TPA: DnaA/Hda family protein [Dongiaceae bacterium]